LLGTWLPAWRPRAKVKETQHPKFYLFDCGVVRALSHRLREPLDGSERGRLLETQVLHELRAHIANSNCGGTLSYYRTPSNTEVDFVWTRGKTRVGIEVKASQQWRSDFGRALRDLRETKTLTSAHAIYLGETPQRDGPIAVQPFYRFVEELGAGRILRA
jgi:predicted AAA+ superfamily ATPase